MYCTLVVSPKHVLLQIEFLGRCCFPRHFISSIKASFRRPQNSNFLFVSLYQKCRKRAFGKHAKASGCSPARRNVTACQSECIKKGWSCILEKNRSPSPNNHNVRKSPKVSHLNFFNIGAFTHLFKLTWLVTLFDRSKLQVFKQCFIRLFL